MRTPASCAGVVVGTGVQVLLPYGIGTGMTLEIESRVNGRAYFSVFVVAKSGTLIQTK